MGPRSVATSFGGAKDYVMQMSSKTHNSNQLILYILVSLFIGTNIFYLCNTFCFPEDAKNIAGHFAMVSDIFLRMIKMVIAPLVFATIVSGISSLGASGGAAGRITF
ncbi:cation:dicarboxylate symporter family transporter [Methylobacterium planeticum]|uniref:Dicarboxylate/amino acid:cation symporter n=1 Tax=Methylobacterium planeticum TaxID=2615211 RepID=A0A6N6MIF5_9HYPH|nr:cation:dicarboxylase symporter family transporter [Methylobacterium planeticum]KAB1068560.1 dicarboxylate/amino acid:cation symporter [Methylobacterium planeticum]